MAALEAIYRTCTETLQKEFSSFIRGKVFQLETDKIFLTIRWERLSSKIYSIGECISVMCVDNLKQEQINVTYKLDKNVEIEVNIVYSKTKFVNYLQSNRDTIITTPTDKDIVVCLISDQTLSMIPITESGLDRIFKNSKYLSILTENLIRLGISLDGTLSLIKTILIGNAYRKKISALNDIFIQHDSSIRIAKLIKEYKIKVCELDTSIRDYVDINGTTFLFLTLSSYCNFKYICIPSGIGFNELIPKKYILEPLAIIGKGTRNKRNYYFILTNNSRYEFEILNSMHQKSEDSIDMQIWDRLNITKPNSFILSKEIIMSDEASISFISENLAEVLIKRTIMLDNMFVTSPINKSVSPMPMLRGGSQITKNT